MKLRVKFVPILILLLLALPLMLLKGCGSSSSALTGGASGLCPDSVAPTGSKILVPDLAAPVIGAPTCYSAIGLQVIGPDGTTPMNGICVVITSDANIALTTQNDAPVCNNAAIAPKTQIVTRTDDTGSVIVDMLTSAATVSGTTYFVELSSGALSKVAVTAKAQ